MTSLGGLVRALGPQGLLTLGDQLVVAHCHHFALFLEQTVLDALGGESLALRRQAAFEAAHAMLAPRCAELRAATPGDKLEAATDLFAAMGHGRLRFQLGPEGGTVEAEALHHAAGFLAKYGGRTKTRAPVDAFAAGYCSAAASLAFPSDWGRFEAEEIGCAARGERVCSFTLTRRAERPRFGAVITRQLVEASEPQPSSDGWDPAPPPRGARGPTPVGAPLDTLTADGRGLIQAYGVYLALLPVGYMGQVTFDPTHLLERRSPELAPVLEALVREAAQVGAFHLLGGMLASTDMAAIHGPPGEDAWERLKQLLSLCRTLGWGALSPVDFTPGRALVLRAPTTPECVYYAARHGATLRHRLVLLQGIALGLMQLLERVDFAAADPIRPDTYVGLFRSGPRLTVEETRSPLRGDPACEVRVEVAGVP